MTLRIQDATADLDIRCARCRQPRSDTGIRALHLADQDIGPVEELVQVETPCGDCGCPTVRVFRNTWTDDSALCAELIAQFEDELRFEPVPLTPFGEVHGEKAAELEQRFRTWLAEHGRPLPPGWRIRFVMKGPNAFDALFLSPTLRLGFRLERIE